MQGEDDHGPPNIKLPPGLGATGEYPEGSCGPDDQGELKAALAADQRTNRLILAFGKPVSWVAMTAVEARSLAMSLLEKAKQLTPPSK